MLTLKMTLNYKNNTTNEFLVPELCLIDVSHVFLSIMVKKLSDIHFLRLINIINTF